MAVCINCGKDVAINYHTIWTKRKTKHYICFDCAYKSTKGYQNARNSKKSV